MQPSSQGKPSETELLRKRLSRLEARVHRQSAEAPQRRATSAAFTAGAVALFLSAAMPWVRGGGGLRISGDGDLVVGSLSGYATGWEVFGVAVGEGHGLFALTSLSLLLLLVFAVGCLLKPFRGGFVTMMVLCVATPVLYFLAWIRSGVGSEGSAGSGVFVMLVACGVLGWAAHRSLDEELSGS